MPTRTNLDSDRAAPATQQWTVAVHPDGPTFAAPADRTILASAESAGLVLASSCRAGTCRTCMRRMVAGSVQYRMEWPGLLAEEKAEGWILPCVAYPMADVVLE